MSVAIQQCSGCRRLYFPDTLLCASCGHPDFSDRVVTEGVVEQFTTIAGGGCLATVRLLGELAVITTLVGGEPVEGRVVPITSSTAAATDDQYVYLPGARPGTTTEGELT